MTLDPSSHGDARFPDFSQLRRSAGHWIAYIGVRRLIGGCVSAVAVCLGGWVLMRPAPPPVEADIPRIVAGATDGATSTTLDVSAMEMKVHVAGAVKNPGVYSMPPGSRVVDAVRAAGGATAGADLERINLAQVVIDTEQVYVPTRHSGAPRVTVAPRLRPVRNAVPSTTVAATANGDVPSTGPDGGSGRIDLNSATTTQLDSLPGVGPATARAIVTYRTRKGPFSKVDDLLNVPGIGPAKLAALRDLVSV